eukprot:1182070-Prorocentrum_minimum.AAC.2
MFQNLAAKFVTDWMPQSFSANVRRRRCFAVARPTASAPKSPTFVPPKSNSSSVLMQTPASESASNKRWTYKHAQEDNRKTKSSYKHAQVGKSLNRIQLRAYTVLSNQGVLGFAPEGGGGGYHITLFGGGIQIP